MATDHLVNLVVMEISQLLADDGGSAELMNVENGVAQIRYQLGKNDDCADCVMSPEEMQQYMMDALKLRAPHVREVTISTE